MPGVLDGLPTRCNRLRLAATWFVAALAAFALVATAAPESCSETASISSSPVVLLAESRPRASLQFRVFPAEAVATIRILETSNLSALVDVEVISDDTRASTNAEPRDAGAIFTEDEDAEPSSMAELPAA